MWVDATELDSRTLIRDGNDKNRKRHAKGIAHLLNVWFVLLLKTMTHRWGIDIDDVTPRIDG